MLFVFYFEKWFCVHFFPAVRQKKKGSCRQKQDCKGLFVLRNLFLVAFFHVWPGVCFALYLFVGTTAIPVSGEPHIWDLLASLWLYCTAVAGFFVCVLYGDSPALSLLPVLLLFVRVWSSSSVFVVVVACIHARDWASVWRRVREKKMRRELKRI